MQKIFIVVAFLFLANDSAAQPYYRCNVSGKYHIYDYCGGLQKCTRHIHKLNGNEVKALNLDLCWTCNKIYNRAPQGKTPVHLLTDKEHESLPKEKSSSNAKSRNSKEYYWLRYLLLGIVTGLFKVGKRWEAIGALFGLGVFIYWMNNYFNAATYKLSYSLIQSSLFTLGFGLSQMLITHIYKNRRADSFIASILEALSKNETELRESKKQNESLEQQIIKLNLTQNQQKEALKEYQRINAELRSINPQSDSKKQQIITNENHITYLHGALKEAKSRVIISSGWIKNSVVNDDFKRLFLNCLKRNVDVFVYYGYQFNNEHNNSDKKAIDFFHQTKARYTNFIFESNPGRNAFESNGNHSKILILDERFVVIGSFNWLSNSGKKKNLEMSLVTNDTKTIRQVISELSS